MGRERREYDRAPFQVPMKFRRAGLLMELWHQGILTDLSAGGLRLVTQELLDLETRLEFQLLLPTQGASYVLLGTVVSEKQTNTGDSEYGVAFDDVTPDKQVIIDQLVEFLMKPPGIGEP